MIKTSLTTVYNSPDQRSFKKDAQMAGGQIKAITLGEALEGGIIQNETLGYFIGRIYLFAVKIGLDSSRLRFRQHMDNEMAHYANDCWDLECKGSFLTDC